MYLIKEKSYNDEDPIYQKIDINNKLMFIPEARVAKDYFNTGFYERGYIDWILNNNFLNKEKNFIDIGAHIGWYTITMSEKSKHTFAFECSPKSFNYLCANIALNNLDYRVSKYNIALSNNENIVDYLIRDPRDGGGNGISKFEYDEKNNTPTIKVQTKTLDSFNLENIGFIKIDVEGHEKNVLEGSINTLKNNNYPPILFESWDESHEKNGYPAIKLKNELFQFLSNLEYKINKLGCDMYIAIK